MISVLSLRQVTKTGHIRVVFGNGERRKETKKERIRTSEKYSDLSREGSGERGTMEQTPTKKEAGKERFENGRVYGSPMMVERLRLTIWG